MAQREEVVCQRLLERLRQGRDPPVEPAQRIVRPDALRRIASAPLPAHTPNVAIKPSYDTTAGTGDHHLSALHFGESQQREHGGCVRRGVVDRLAIENQITVERGATVKEHAELDAREAEMAETRRTLQHRQFCSGVIQRVRSEDIQREIASMETRAACAHVSLCLTFVVTLMDRAHGHPMEAYCTKMLTPHSFQAPAAIFAALVTQRTEAPPAAPD